ncbi:methyltransferase [Saccharopolyspora phatthalungensis]|uniref:Methyltransferase n=1 Tax=Saccharopolyspora phatthalungensis TaxID=664693 RepID=A0A840QDM1_9PSEU|nr:methyltransferase [Saccharopolyspora phatthalungensis]MBB5158021.1 hypothetical protein [Saccharopolyspora phatthalungensis]
MTASGWEPDPDRILQLGLSFFGSRALLSAVELGVFTELADGPVTGERLRSRIGLHPRGARDFLDALVAMRVLDREDGKYSNSPDAQRFLVRGHEEYIGGSLEMAASRLWGFWGDLTTALRTGGPQSEKKDGEPDGFDAAYADPARLRTMLAAMTGITLPSARSIAAKFPFDRYQTFIDIGTGEGALPVQVAAAHPHITGGGFDLPPVGPAFDEYVGKHDLGDRLRFWGGDFFAGPLPQADVLCFGHVLHDWDLDRKRELLAKAYTALPDEGALIVHETLIDDDRRDNLFGLLMSLDMLIESTGGFDFTAADCRQWLREAGFRKTWTTELTGPHSMIVAVK